MAIRLSWRIDGGGYIATHKGYVAFVYKTGIKNRPEKWGMDIGKGNIFNDTLEHNRESMTFGSKRDAQQAAREWLEKYGGA